MAENCKWCGAAPAASFDGADLWQCGTGRDAQGKVLVAYTCRANAAEAKLATLLAELAKVEHEDMLLDGTGIDGSVSDWLEKLVEQRASSLDPTYSALREELAETQARETAMRLSLELSEAELTRLQELQGKLRAKLATETGVTKKLKASMESIAELPAHCGGSCGEGCYGCIETAISVAEGALEAANAEGGDDGT